MMRSRFHVVQVGREDLTLIAECAHCGERFVGDAAVFPAFIRSGRDLTPPIAERYAHGDLCRGFGTYSRSILPLLRNLSTP